MDTQPRPDDRYKTPDDRYDRPATTFTLRDLLMVGFRRKRLVVGTFLALTTAATVVVLLRPPKYQAEMKILIERERADPVVTSDAAAGQSAGQIVTEEELNSEVELLKSRDLLAQVVVAKGLQENQETSLRDRLASWLGRTPEGTSEERAIARAVDTLASRLDVEPLMKSNMIRVRYSSGNPTLAAGVLNTLADRYLDKHLAVHRPSGTFDFFQKEAQSYGAQLKLAQARVVDASREQGVVSVTDEKAIALRQMGTLEDTELATQAQLAETSQRMRALEAQLASTPERTTTDIHVGSSRLLEQLQSELLSHELKRIELLRAFQPTYPPVKEEEAKIAKIREMIASAEQSPLVEKTTGRNPTYDYLVNELDKSRADLAGLQARAESTSRGLASVRAKARQLEQVGLQQQVLLRAASQAEQNYLIYAQKREEARISNALDAQRILNLAVAEKASVPFEPSGPSPLMLLIAGMMLAAIASLILALIADHWDPSFRTPDEVQAFLDIPVVASIPRR